MFHGSLFKFFQNMILDANPFETNCLHSLLKSNAVQLSGLTENRQAKEARPAKG